MPWPPIDLPLSRRLEHAEGAANAAFVDARARVVPTHGAEWRAIDGVRHAQTYMYFRIHKQTYQWGVE